MKLKKSYISRFQSHQQVYLTNIKNIVDLKISCTNLRDVWRWSLRVKPGSAEISAKFIEFNDLISIVVHESILLQSSSSQKNLNHENVKENITFGRYINYSISFWSEKVSMTFKLASRFQSRKNVFNDNIKFDLFSAKTKLAQFWSLVLQNKKVVGIHKNNLIEMKDDH